ncbi:MAG: hypothetical protein FWG37_06010, partial [Clostridia bacterium]|nr:hypothetical protein [Clostridia bacterium]
GRPNPNGYQYSLKHETVDVIPIPSPTRIPDKKVEHVRYLDETYEASKGQEGYVVRTHLITKDVAGNVIETKEITLDTYRAMPPRIYVGVERRPQ